MKNYLISAGISVVIVVAGFLLYHPADVVQQVADNGQQFGGVATLNNVESPLMGVGGVQTYFARSPLLASSSMLCHIKNPFGATSTMSRFSLQLTNAPFGTAVTVDVSTTTNSQGNGSSSPAFVFAHSLPNQQSSINWLGNSEISTALVWGSASVDGSQSWILGPTDWVSARVATATAGTLATNPQGNCQAVFSQL